MRRSRVRVTFPAPEKLCRFFDRVFQLNPSRRTEEIHLRWMKSLRDEIRLRRKDGFNSAESTAFDFIRAKRGFHYNDLNYLFQNNKNCAEKQAGGRGKSAAPSPNEIRQATASQQSRFARFTEPPTLPFSSHFQSAM